MAKTVLIVEDNELNMKLFHDLLEAHGYSTVGTRNGIEALDLARKHRPDLILMDIQLPEVSGPRSHQVAEGRCRAAPHSGGRRHRLCHEGRRGAHPRGRLRGLSVEADLGRQVHRDRPSLSRQSGSKIAMTARVLVVDDVPANVKLLEARLSAEYFDVVTAMSGQEALAICERAECDIVLLDVMMPDMDGFEVCRRLKSQLRDPPHSGRHGDGARPAVRPRARARSRRRRFSDQADPRNRADRAGALAGAAQDGDRRIAHARADLARHRHRIARARGAGRYRPRRPRADRRRSPGVLRARRGDARRGAERRGRDRSERGAVPRRRGQLRPADRVARAWRISTRCGCAASCARSSAPAICRSW